MKVSGTDAAGLLKVFPMLAAILLPLFSLVTALPEEHSLLLLTAALEFIEDMLLPLFASG